MSVSVTAHTSGFAEVRKTCSSSSCADDLYRNIAAIGEIQCLCYYYFKPHQGLILDNSR